ncbi:MAG: STAS domain-containing protein [Planctomycetes bacterium]|nr:STAS domain-containing protein [Planctomycetota bacterium]
MSHLDFELRDIPHIASAQFITLSGAIDASTSIEFQDYLDNLVKKGTLNFIFDMNGVTFINSSGLGLIVNLADTAVSKKGSLVLINTHAKIRIVFQTLGLDNYFKMFGNLSDALRFLTQNLPQEQQDVIIKSAEDILQTEPQTKHATVTDKTLPAPVVALPIKTHTAPVDKKSIEEIKKQQEQVPAQPIAYKEAATPDKQYVPPPQPMYAPPPDQIPQKSTDRITRIIGTEKRKVSAFILIPPTLPNFGLTYTHVQGACVSVNVIAARVDYNDPQFMEKALQMINKVNFIIADFTGADQIVLKQAHYARYKLKPPKPILGIIQGSPSNLPPQWQKTSFISYKMTNQGLVRLKTMLEQTVSRAMSKL